MVPLLCVLGALPAAAVAMAPKQQINLARRARTADCWLGALADRMEPGKSRDEEQDRGLQKRATAVPGGQRLPYWADEEERIEAIERHRLSTGTLPTFWFPARHVAIAAGWPAIVAGLVRTLCAGSPRVARGGAARR